MIAMKVRVTGMLLTVLAVGAVGCVAQSEVDDLQTLYRQSQEQVVDLQHQLENANNRIAVLQQAAGSNADLLKQLEAAKAERDRLAAALEAAEAQLRNAQVGPMLPEDLDAALGRLAAANPEVMSYDPDLGMVKFRSDFTFDLGSVNVKPQATQTLQRLASVLNSEAARPYEIRIVGHTDNVPIGNPATRAKHPTNWHLSTHRAIAVKDVLDKAGVAPVRMAVSGYSHYRPVVANGPGGAEANRRVEIYLVSMTAQDFAAADRVREVAPQVKPSPVREEAPQVKGGSAQPAPGRATVQPEPPAAFK